MNRQWRTTTLTSTGEVLSTLIALQGPDGYGSGCRYAHDEEGGIADQQHLPDSLAGGRFYEPTERGYEGRGGAG